MSDPTADSNSLEVHGMDSTTPRQTKGWKQELWKMMFVLFSLLNSFLAASGWLAIVEIFVPPFGDWVIYPGNTDSLTGKVVVLSVYIFNVIFTLWGVTAKSRYFRLFTYFYFLVPYGFIAYAYFCYLRILRM